MEVLITFFVKYLLTPILVVILLLVIGNLLKLKSEALKMKKVIIFILILSLILALPSLFGFLRNEFVWGGLMLNIFSYLIIGGIFIFVRNLDFYLTIKGNENSKKTKKQYHVDKIIEIIILLIAIIISTWTYYLVFYKISQLPYVTWAMFSTLWFLIPYFYIISKELYFRIEAPFYKEWVVEKSNEYNKYWENIDTFRLIQVNVKIKRKPEDKEYSSFSVKLPKEVPLGIWFNQFIEHQNIRFPQNAINPVAEKGTLLGWMFYTNKWFSFPLFIKVLDPEQDGAFNKIKNKQVVYIRRTTIK